MNRRQWNNLLILLTIALILVCAFSPTVMSSEGYRLRVTFNLTGETACGTHVFHSLEACEGTKDWFIEQSAWHGQNEYACVLDNQCPNN